MTVFNGCPSILFQIGASFLHSSVSSYVIALEVSEITAFLGPFNRKQRQDIDVLPYPYST